MYAVVGEKTGVIRHMSESFTICESWEKYGTSYGDPCVIVKVPQLMLDDFGARLLALLALCKDEEMSE